MYQGSLVGINIDINIANDNCPGRQDILKSPRKQQNIKSAVVVSHSKTKKLCNQHSSCTLNDRNIISTKKEIPMTSNFRNNSASSSSRSNTPPLLTENAINSIPLIVDKSRSIAIKNQKYKRPRPIIIPVNPKPALTIEELKDLSKKRAAKSQSIEACIMAEPSSHASRFRNVKNKKPKQQAQPFMLPPLPPHLMSIETLKGISIERSRLSKEIAARIIAEDTKDLSVTPEGNRYPCPAQKMGPAHNKNTAFFHIPTEKSKQHGLPLICSHALCRKRRLKFVFCKYCNAPVSRMKFEERHAHPEHILLALAAKKICNDSKDI
mmetsp:Transcript_14157/g.16244  ORF Transcript_14157/g.16244 Transcript_14157/m.16244 type:complete len:322 (+) Transcript_14157:67-1032(+)